MYHCCCPNAGCRIVALITAMIVLVILCYLPVFDAEQGALVHSIFNMTNPDSFISRAIHRYTNTVWGSLVIGTVDINK